jgi:starvation-inducible DNA-binding protein
MKDLVNEMKISLASVFSFYLKAQFFHWNVEGPNFHDYHAFFGTLYEDVHGSVDAFAEQIRAMDEYAPGGLGRFKDLSIIEDKTSIPSALSMVKELLSDNEKIIAQIEKTNALADSNNKKGLCNFLEERIDIHSKHSWMLRAMAK